LHENCQLDGQPELNRLPILALDKISIRKGHRYLTVVLDYLSGRILFVGKNRKAKTLKWFFNNLSVGQRKVIKPKAYGFHDPRYLTLKIYQAFHN
jgi:transposase